MSRFSVCFTSVFTAILACALLAACSGGGTDPGSGGGNGGGGSGPPGGGTPPVLRALTVLVTAPDATPLPGAEVMLYNQSQTALVASAETGSDGKARFAAVPEGLSIAAVHGLGHHGPARHTIVEGIDYEARLRVHSQMTVAMLPAQVIAGSVSADRTQLDLRLTVVASPSMPLRPASYGGLDASPYVRLGDCWVWTDASIPTPRCNFPDPAGTSVVTFSYDARGVAAWPGPHAPFSATLLLDQGQRASTYDPHELRWIAARHFAERIRAGAGSSHAGVSAIAGFAGVATDPAWMPLLLPAPAWQGADPAAAYDDDPLLRQATLDNLRAQAGGASPVLDALAAVPSLLAAHAPPGRRTLVAMLGGGDDTAAGEAERQAKLQQVAGSLAAAAIDTVIISSRLADPSPARDELAELAAAISAPLIVAGAPENWVDEWTHRDGLHPAMSLAAEIVSGTPLPTLDVVFRLRRPASDPFVAGSLLRGTLHVESEICPVGCAELPLPFAVRIP
jgi:hypothetical protein